MTWAKSNCLTVQSSGVGGLERGVGGLSFLFLFFLWGGVWSERRCQMLAVVSENNPKSLVLSIKTSIMDYSHKNIPSAY